MAVQTRCLRATTLGIELGNTAAILYQSNPVIFLSKVNPALVRGQVLL